MTNKYTLGDNWQREILCSHGVGHGGGIHTCEGCCVVCPECLGKGFTDKWTKEPDPCYKCNGIGVVINEEMGEERKTG